MPASPTSARAADATPAGAGLARVEPNLRDLMALAGAARRLPPLTPPRRTRAAGQYLSRRRGRGMEYDESRPYQPGDDIRQLDWRVTARTGKPHTKLFREERERPVFLCIDLRPAMFFATRGVFKAVQAARIASLVGWRAEQSGDRVGALVFGAGEHHEVAPRRGQTALVRLLKVLVENAERWRTVAAAAAPTGSALSDTVERLRRVAKPGSQIFFISDFRDLDESVCAALARLALHTDLALVGIHDPLEAAFPVLDGGGALSDTRETLRLASIDDAHRAAYAARFEARQERLRRLCREQGLPHVAVDTVADPFGGLVRLLTT
ncbi:MAG: DUF58 domain-containing protein [Gammaproteobacteria bacterium]